MNSIKLPNYVDRAKIFNFLFKNTGDIPLFCVFTGYIGDSSKVVKYDSGNIERFPGMNEEHIIPKLFYRNTHPEFAYDLHITAPAIQFLNTARGNLRFGQVKSGDQIPQIIATDRQYYINDDSLSHGLIESIYRDISNGIGIIDYKMSSTSRSFSATSAAKFVINPSSSDGTGFVEPADNMKGYVSRAIFYFLLLQLPFLPPAEKAQVWNTFLDRGKLLPILGEWCIKFPPSEWEHRRNREVYKLQKNVNPFIGVLTTRGKYVKMDRIEEIIANLISHLTTTIGVKAASVEARKIN